MDDAGRAQGAPKQSALESLWPALPAVQEAKHFHELATDTVRNEVGRAADDEFPRAFGPPGPAAFGKACKPRGRKEDAFHLPVCGGGPVLGNEGP